MHTRYLMNILRNNIIDVDEYVLIEYVFIRDLKELRVFEK